MSRWLYYALGGGLGHLTRGVALARRARRRGVEVEIFTNSPFADAVDAPLRRFATDVAPRAVRDAIDGTPHDVLVVDTFPRGLGGELVDYDGPKVLVHRDLNPSYVDACDVAAAVATYDLVIVPGEDAAFASSPRAVRTAPWLTLDAARLLSRDEARRALGARGRLVAVLASGRPEEGPFFARLAARLDATLDADVRLFVPTPRPDLPNATALWPFLAYVRGVDVIVGAGGYNTVHEARATQTPFVAIAMPRRYDRQHVRLRTDERARDEDTIVDAVARHLARPRREAPPAYVDGAGAAADAILSQLPASLGRGHPADPGAQLEV